MIGSLRRCCLFFAICFFFRLLPLPAVSFLRCVIHVSRMDACVRGRRGSPSLCARASPFLRASEQDDKKDSERGSTHDSMTNKRAWKSRNRKLAYSTVGTPDYIAPGRGGEGVGVTRARLLACLLACLPAWHARMRRTCTQMRPHAPLTWTRTHTHIHTHPPLEPHANNTTTDFSCRDFRPDGLRRKLRLVVARSHHVRGTLFVFFSKMTHPSLFCR